MKDLEAIKDRHSVRNYEDKPIEASLVKKLEQLIGECNAKGNLHMQLITEEAGAFQSLIPAFGRFKGVKNYIALVAEKRPGVREACGYYGEKIVLFAHKNGLHTCWVSGSYNKKKCRAQIGGDEELLCLIAIGYGKNTGKPHKTKSLEQVCSLTSDEWFKQGVHAALLAPTGMNRQDFYFRAEGDKVMATSTTDSPLSEISLGIVKYHFEIGSGKKCFGYAD